MEALRKTRIKTQNQKVIIELPDNFNPKEVDVILLASEGKVDEQKELDIDKWRKELVEFYSKFNVDLSNFKFNRDELYDRP